MSNIQALDTPRVSTAPSSIRRWSGRLAAFFIGQGAVQALNLLAGFIVVRYLSVSEYAAYSFTQSFQASAVVLVEIGLSGSVIALLAGRKDPSDIGRYIKSIRYYRNRFFLILLPVLALIFPFLATRHGWGGVQTLLLLLAILVSLYFQGVSAHYSIPLLVHQDLGAYYRTPSIFAGGRFLLSIILQLSALLSSVSGVWVNALSTMAEGLSYRRKASKYISEPNKPDLEANREVLRYIAPQVPNVVYFALRGQIVVLTVSWLGHASVIAEVGALGRIGQLFAMLSAFNAVVVAPAIARVSSSLLLSRYCLVLSGAAVLSLALISIAALFPSVILLILGQKYAHLKVELVWMMISACMIYLNSVMWTMHRARMWIFKWALWLDVILPLSAQIACLSLMRIDTTLKAFYLSVITSSAVLVVQVALSVYGFCFHRRHSSGFA